MHAVHDRTITHCQVIILSANDQTIPSANGTWKMEKDTWHFPWLEKSYLTCRPQPCLATLACTTFWPLKIAASTSKLAHVDLKIKQLWLYLWEYSCATWLFSHAWYLCPSYSYFSFWLLLAGMSTHIYVLPLSVHKFYKHIMYWWMKFASWSVKIEVVIVDDYRITNVGSHSSFLVETVLKIVDF